MVNSRKLEDLHPVVQELCRKHIEACRKRGVEMLVTNTLRDAEYQEYLYSQGRTRPGNIVTNMKQIGPHAFGLAYDVVPIVKRKAVWGGNWKSIVDMPHFEYTDGLTAAQLRAGKRPSWWDAKV